ncbi:MAG: glycosyltransferase family 39 protein [Pyrinomonadaceae bacterium]|nr:glycosyltransferase family 39 protein [Pyrinomonadaceae bacterium]
MTPTESVSGKRFFSNSLPLLCLFLIAIVALLWKLGAGSLAAWDEAIYAQVSKEMLSRRDWLTLHWQYKPWFEKPPLLMWMTALFYSLFGVSEFTARLASALSGLALLWVTYLIGRLSHGRRVGLLSAIVLLTCYHFLSFSRFGTMDVMLALFTCVAVYAYLRLREDENQRWWYLIWCSCALALMAKGAGGIIAPASILLALIFDRRFAYAVRAKHFWLASLLAVLIVAPWHALMYLWYGRVFVDEYIGYHIIERSTRTLEGHPSSYLYFVGKLVDGFFPWCLVVPFAVFSFVRRNLKERSQSWVLLILAALVFGVYTLIPTRRPWYIVPLYPALSIMIAAFLTNLYRAYQSRAVYRRIIIAASVFLIITGGLYSFASLYLNYRPEEPVARLAREARSATHQDKDSLILLSEAEPFYAQTPLFYSDRPIQQAYAFSRQESSDAKRYVHYENLADIMRDADAKRIILSKENVERLSADYDIQVLAEADQLVYATIKRKR